MFFPGKIEHVERGHVRDEVLRVIRDQVAVVLHSLRLMIELEGWSIRAPGHSPELDSLDHTPIILQVVDARQKRLDDFSRGLVGCEVVVSCDVDLVLVGKGGKDLSKTLELFHVLLLAHVSRVDEDVSGGQVCVEFAVRVRDGHNAHNSQGSWVDGDGLDVVVFRFREA